MTQHNVTKMKTAMMTSIRGVRRLAQWGGALDSADYIFDHSSKFATVFLTIVTDDLIDRTYWLFS